MPIFSSSDKARGRRLGQNLTTTDEIREQSLMFMDVAYESVQIEKKGAEENVMMR